MPRLQLDFYYGKESEQYTFYRLPKVLVTDPTFVDLSDSAKLLYGLMLDRMGLSAKNGWYDETGRVYIKYSFKSIMTDLNCAKEKASKLMRELEEYGLMERKSEIGKANIIYVKNFIASEESEKKENEDSSKTASNKCDNRTGSDIELDESAENHRTCTEIEPVRKTNKFEYQEESGSESEQVVVRESNTNKNILNNTDLNNTNLIHLSAEQSTSASDSTDEMDYTRAYMEIIKENIEYDLIMSDKSSYDLDLYEELYQLICDVVCVPRKTIKIGGENYPYELVKSRFLKLNYSHLQYVIGCLQKNTTKVNNIKAYLITTLYNAPSTMGNYYRSEVNHDMYGAWRDEEV